ncbi:MAG: Tic20 family protein [Pseudanabaenaceae cyanobacterium bins.68]|nr:Tic20 family protein [Pseudanabaenaceae cyanobacterium bins.68]
MSATISAQDRFYASISYILPISAAVVFGNTLFAQVPYLLEVYSPFIWLYRNVLMLPLVPLLGINGEFAIFLALYLLVLRNPQVSRFVRFNLIQAFLLQIVLFIAQILVQALELALAGVGGYVLTVLVNTTFMGISLCCIYAIARAVRAEYTDIPGISTAALIQTDR